mmetsp:Transcript_38210/g.64181  ORF Transcript_38210/g.64181 Transcript_38210/m.64181 type:complete len:326 (+) Transcript_38210:419-1396(+)
MRLETPRNEQKRQKFYTHNAHPATMPKVQELHHFDSMQEAIQWDQQRLSPRNSPGRPGASTGTIFWASATFFVCVLIVWMFSLAPRPDFIDDDERDLIDMKEDLEALLLEGTINARPNRVGPMLDSFKRTPQAQTEARRVQSFSDPVTTVVVFLVKELHKNMLVFVMKNQDVRIVCADKRLEGESPTNAAQRVLTKHTDLRGPPEIEFLQRIPISAGAEKYMVGGCASTERCAFYVAMVRNERILMRGFGTVKQALSRGDFIDLHRLEEEAAREDREATLSKYIISGLSTLHEYLHPWLSTLGQNGSGGCNTLHEQDNIRNTLQT